MIAGKYMGIIFFFLLVNGQVSFHHPSGTSLPKKTLYASSHHLLNWEPKWIRFEHTLCFEAVQYDRKNSGLELDSFWAVSRVPSVRVQAESLISESESESESESKSLRTRVLHITQLPNHFPLHHFEDELYGLCNNNDALIIKQQTD